MISDDIAVESALARVRAGEVDVFEQIVRHHQAQLRAWLACRCAPEIEPDEVAQRTFIEAFTHLADYRPGSNFRAWLWAIARCQLLGEAKRLSRRRDQEVRQMPQRFYAALVERVERDSDEDEHRVETIRRCMKSLGEPAQRLIDLRYAQDLPLEAIAIGLGRSVGAIKKNLFIIRRKLHDCVARALASVSGGDRGPR